MEKIEESKAFDKYKLLSLGFKHAGDEWYALANHAGEVILRGQLTPAGNILINEYSLAHERLAFIIIGEITKTALVADDLADQ